MSAATGADGALLSLVQSLDATFARAIDRGEHDLLREVLAPDVEYVTSGVVLQGVDAVVARFAARRAPRTTRHQAGAPHVVRRTGALLKTTSVWTCWAAHGGRHPLARRSDGLFRGGLRGHLEPGRRRVPPEAAGDPAALPRPGPGAE